MKTIILSFALIISMGLIAQNETDLKTIKYFEDCIINQKIPQYCVDYKYEGSYRVIVWNDPLIKNYKYSSEAFDKLGYDYVKTTDGDNSQYSEIYRNCSKGIVVEVTEWYNFKLSISIQWYATNVRRSIGYLMFCK